MRLLNNLADTLVKAVEGLTSSTSGTEDGGHGCGTFISTSSHDIDTAFRILTKDSIKARLHSSFLDSSAGSRSGRIALRTAFPEADSAGIGIDTGSSLTVQGPWSAGGGRKRQPVCFLPTSFKTLKGMKGQKLGPVKLRLLYQSPEIYSTDFAEYDKIKKKFKFGCSRTNKEPANPHPTIRWKKLTRYVQVQLKDTYDNEILWDAVYKGGGLAGSGGLQLSGRAQPVKDQSPKPDLMKLCIPSWEQGPRLFDLKVCSRDYFYKDQMDTPAGDREGWHGLDVPCGHIGIEAYRMPEIKGTLQDGHPKLGRWKWNDKKTTYGPGNYSDGPVHYFDPMERLRNKEINLLEDEKTGDDGTNYYPWIFKLGAKSKNNYEYLFKVSPPPLVHEDVSRKIIKEEMKKEADVGEADELTRSGR